MVRSFLRDHVLRVLDISSPTYVAHVLWGAAFARVFGLSHVVLRAATLVLAALALVSLDRLSRPRAREDGLLSPAVLLAVNPLFLALSFSGMTDVPLLAWSLSACWLYRKAFESDGTVWWLSAAAACSWAYLIRQTGAFVPLAALAVLAIERRATLRRLLLVLGPAALTVAAHRWWFLHVHGSTWADLAYAGGATWEPLAHPARFLGEAYLRGAGALMTLGLFTAPLAAATALEAPRRPRPAALAFLLAFVLPLLVFEGALPYQAHVLWRGGLGACSLLGADSKAGGLLGSPALLGLLTVLSLASLAVWSSRAVELRDAWRDRGAALAGLSGLLQFGASLLAARSFDRYLLPLIPGALLLTSAAAPRARRPLLPGALALLFLAWSLAGLGDELSWGRARWSAGEAAESAGVPRERLFNGLEWVGLETYETSAAELRARKPLAEIGEWEWLQTREFDAETSFSPSPPPGMSPLLAVAYRTPLSFAPQSVYVYVRSAPVLQRSPADR